MDNPHILLTNATIFFQSISHLGTYGFMKSLTILLFQNIEEGKTYNLVMYVRSPESVELTASLTCSRPSRALQNLASAYIQYVPFP